MNGRIDQMRGVGPKRAQALAAAGLVTRLHLLHFYPVSYKDLTVITPLDQVRSGEVYAVRAKVSSKPSLRRAANLWILTFTLCDETDRIEVVWYNQRYLAGVLKEGQQLLLYGRVQSQYGRLQMICPTIEEGAAIVPVYRAVKDVPAKVLAQLVKSVVEGVEGYEIPSLPPALSEKHGLMDKKAALRTVHFPTCIQDLDRARKTLAFEELLYFQVALKLTRGHTQTGVRIASSKAQLNEFLKTLPYAPTGAQFRVIEEIVKDMGAAKPMARLVQGDVGSGKTMVAFAALNLAAKNGYQGAMMAPTEVLALQHYAGAQQALAPLGIRVGLLTGSLGAKGRREALTALAEGLWDVVVGTHALISKDVKYKNLGLVVSDEQHRFGVNQRTMLSEKGEFPNVLVMSATPIPRTLALILYGDLDISIVDEMPPGRVPVSTHIVPETKRAGMYRFVREQVLKGRQAYVVCPMIEESEVVDAVSAAQLYESLKNEALQGVRVGMIHGQMSPSEKEEALSMFAGGQMDVLVSTTVIEVGVNVPNATIMIVEDAHRFGLSQLHQLRGRVGRGAQKSWCFLMGEPNERLKLLSSTNDGFVIAQKDMEMRGPGELLGTRQHGLSEKGAGAMMADTLLLSQAHTAARRMFENPEDAETRIVFKNAKAIFADRLFSIGIN